MRIRLVDVQQSVLKKNVTLAQRLRDRFSRSGTFVVNVLSSPGAGKTTLLEATLQHVAGRIKIAALVGDQATDNDANRLRRAAVPVKQITTGAECRLDADMVTAALRDFVDADALDCLAIENVGNLICPAEYDLGEDLRVVLFSVTEGEDKPLKYPLAFNTAHLVLVTKIDLAGAVVFDRQSALANIRSVNPGVPILELSARGGDGMGAWFALLDDRIAAKRGALAAT